MPGHNHYHFCTCGWCSGGAGGGSQKAGNQTHGVAPEWPGNRATASSYTDPNAYCPVCGARVFFYRSPHGGRVFFDDLGPPWPKHPCTDNPRISVRLRTDSAPPHDETVAVPPYNPRWKEAGWEPVRISRVDRERDWALLKIHRYGGSGFILRVIPWREGLLAGAPAYIKPLNKLGIGRISVLIEANGDWLPHEDRLVHRTFSASMPKTLDDACKRNAESALKIARAAYRPWLAKPQKPKDQKILPFVPPSNGKYNLYVDLRIAREWLKRAAALGSREAAVALQTEPEFRVE